MGKGSAESRPELFRQVTINNLKRQFELLRDMVSVGLSCDFKINLHIIIALHNIGMVHLVDMPGTYRTEHAHITGSKHEPADPQFINQMMLDYIQDIHRMWSKETNPYVLASLVLWRLVWIHPFEDGNGRTARALAYLVICLKLGRWIPGTNTIPSLIKETSPEYTAHLRYADETHRAGEVDLVPMANYLSRLVRIQIESVKA